MVRFSYATHSITQIDDLQKIRNARGGPAHACASHSPKRMQGNNCVSLTV
jgi:hypothetical protein